jgi:hypothetical protein
MSSPSLWSPQDANSRETRGFAAETKFLLDPDRAREVRDWARALLQPDPHASGLAGDEYRTTTLYLDTPAFDVFARRGSYRRAKYRVRRYGCDDVVFLERKMRTSVLLAKRRSAIALSDLELVGEPDGGQPWAGAWFRDRLAARRLGPVVQVAYDRTARIGHGEFGLFRLTLDDNLRARPVNALAFAADAGERVLPESVILELKYRFAMPALFKALVADFGLETTVVSKYRLAAEALGLTARRKAASATPPVRTAYA